MATSEGIPSSIDIEFLELNDNPYYKLFLFSVFAAKGGLVGKLIYSLYLCKHLQIILPYKRRLNE